MPKHTISLCMIVKNEEKYLDKCLRSVQGKVDDIIIVDTGSNDTTIEIAEKYNAVIKHFPWINDFAAARNYSINEVNTEYILVLDADEYFDDSADLQKDLIKNKDYYRLTINNYEGIGKVVLHKNVRLFKAGVGIRYSGKLHEHLNIYDKDSNYIGEESEAVIHHIGYLPEVILEKDKKKRNQDIMAAELRDNPTGYSYYNMGITYMNDEHYDKALEMFRTSYPLSKNKIYVKDIFVRMGDCLSRLGRTEEGIKLLLDAIKAFPTYTDLHYTLGKLFMGYGYLRDAESEFKECLSLGERVENITTEGIGSYLAHYHLALVYEKTGRNGDAFEEAYEAITKNKCYTPALSLYIKLMRQSGIQPSEIQEQLNEVYKVNNIEELNVLIYSLYEIRHPLLSNYIYALEGTQLLDFRAVAMMLDKKYDSSLEAWGKMPIIPEPNILDALIMCRLSNDKQLLEKVKASTNYSNSEWKTISDIILNKNNEKLSLTPGVEKLLLGIAEYLIKLKEFDQFDYISSFLLQCGRKTQEMLSVVLLENGYTDTALNLLEMIIEKYPESAECDVLIAEAYIRQGKLKEALKWAVQGLAHKNEYSTYEKIYVIYEKMGDKESLKDLLKIMKDKFTYSIWLKRI